MSRIVVFGAGGRAGRAAVAEARRRGHEVTAVMRDPSKYGELAAHNTLPGDVTDADAVAALAAGHDAAIHAAADLTTDPGVFFPAAARALLDGLTRAGVGRLVAVGLASYLPDASGTLLMNTPGYPQEYRPFLDGHHAGAAVLHASTDGPDWVLLSPSGDFDHQGSRTGGYGHAPGDADARVSYADFAIALLDEIDAPRHHRTHVGVTARA
ncbi:NAD(P)H-binding protein [Streptomyces sp. AV19]|uniref:NAD(P)-dependent oxidoreductase n=1 Tax=Streptomyces sp. AV19 TaxID=2793068 RepID=UPI0018FE134C|nr:NAD(P)H-binding protein [Streptomyces sp. AV19]MBH1933641.1 NAD(P)H-binding protein [Streptomyces sp. AV19]MDG4535853.1 NAD(P)H-binding protein [Streptomyces sp. AV19]